jgi:hypothetical protein
MGCGAGINGDEAVFLDKMSERNNVVTNARLTRVN